MDARAEQMQQLKQMGLSLAASRAYLALIELGGGEARAVSDLANIPTAKVYGTLEQLQERGLVEVTMGKPRRYTPVTMEAFIEREIERNEERLGALKARKGELVSLFPVHGATDAVERARLASVSGRRNVLQRFRDAAMGAQRDIFICTSQELLAPESPLGRLLDQARDRGVHVHAVAVPPGGAAEHVAIASFDNSRAIFLRIAPGTHRQPRERADAIYTSERAFVEPLRGLIAFEHAHLRTDASLCEPLSPEAIAARVRALVMVGASSLSVLLPAGATSRTAADHLWSAARVSGVRSRILLNMAPGDARALEKELEVPPTAQLRQTHRPDLGCFAILGGTHAIFLAASPPGDPEPRYAMTAEPALVGALAAGFESAWAEGILGSAPRSGAVPASDAAVGRDLGASQGGAA